MRRSSVAVLGILTLALSVLPQMAARAAGCNP